jgi:hypothetical protein
VCTHACRPFRTERQVDAAVERILALSRAQELPPPGPAGCSPGSHSGSSADPAAAAAEGDGYVGMGEPSALGASSWGGDRSDDLEEVYSDASLAGRAPPVHSPSGSTVAGSSSAASSSSPLVAAWQRAPVAATLALLGAAGTALSLEVRGLPGLSGGVVFDATVLASALQLALAADADCAEALEEVAGFEGSDDEDGGPDENDNATDEATASAGLASGSNSSAASSLWRSRREQRRASGRAKGGGAAGAAATAPLLRWLAGSQRALAQCAPPGSRRLVRLRCSQLPPSPNLKWLSDLLNYAPPPQPPLPPPWNAAGPPLPPPHNLSLAPSCLPARSTLRYLELCGCGLRDHMLAAPPQLLPSGAAFALLESLRALESLDLTDNWLTRPPQHLPPKLRALKVRAKHATRPF